MAVKIFFGTIILLVVGTITGFAYWFFPILDQFHQKMGGKPLEDPRGDWIQQINMWLNFLPDNIFIRAGVVAGAVVGYLFISTFATLMALRVRRRRLALAEREASRVRSLNAYNLRH